MQGRERSSRPALTWEGRVTKQDSRFGDPEDQSACGLSPPDLEALLERSELARSISAWVARLQYAEEFAPGLVGVAVEVQTQLRPN